MLVVCGGGCVADAVEIGVCWYFPHCVHVCECVCVFFSVAQMHGMGPIVVRFEKGYKVCVCT